MNNNISIIKGIHPGIYLDYELKRRKINKGRLALSIQEYSQTLSSITKGKRNMNAALALKIEKVLGMEEGYLMVLQAYYEIEREKKKQHTNHPDLNKIRRILFWDTTFEKIDWEKHKSSVIKRVFERGNEEEKSEITRFYGKETINSIIENNG